eukprot:3211509-Pleurochrysis_carterae.AAC.3
MRNSCSAWRPRKNSVTCLISFALELARKRSSSHGCSIRIVMNAKHALLGHLTSSNAAPGSQQRWLVPACRSRVRLKRQLASLPCIATTLLQTTTLSPAA